MQSRYERPGGRSRAPATFAVSRSRHSTAEPGGDACAAVRGSLTCNRMVVIQAASERRADRLFHALADQTRRDIVRRTARGEHSVSALAREYPMSVTAVQKHVAVLEAAGLVTKHRRGRAQIVRAERDAIRRTQLVLDELEQLWQARVAQIDQLLAEPDEGDRSECPSPTSRRTPRPAPSP